MSGQLQTAPVDAPERCSFCPREAVGPCASCKRLVCGECCTLTEGGVKTWAICLACDRKKGSWLGGAWGSLGLWLIAILALLAALVAALEWLWPRR
jgi:hypothetical protein